MQHGMFSLPGEEVSERVGMSGGSQLRCQLHLKMKVWHRGASRVAAGSDHRPLLHVVAGAYPEALLFQMAHLCVEAVEVVDDDAVSPVLLPIDVPDLIFVGDVADQAHITICRC